MARFNHGEGYHSSEAVTEGKLRGATDTDYFYFFCPKCPDDEILRILDYEVRSEQPDNPYNKELNPKGGLVNRCVNGIRRPPPGDC
jgi:hypothetical protein